MSEVLKLTTMEKFIRWHVWTMEKMCQLCEEQSATTGVFIEKISTLIDLKVGGRLFALAQSIVWALGHEDEADR